MIKIYQKYVAKIINLTEQGVFVEVIEGDKNYKGLILNSNLLNFGKYKDILYWKDKEILTKLISIKNLKNRKLYTFKEVFPTFEFFEKNQEYDSIILEELEFSYIVATMGWTYAIKKKKFYDLRLTPAIHEQYRLLYIGNKSFDVVCKLNVN